MFDYSKLPKPITRPQDSPDWNGVGGKHPSETGLGDRIESIVQPIAKVIDKIAGTNIQGCGACQERKKYLNKKFPNTY